jgi:hypothetical protein
MSEKNSTPEDDPFKTPIHPAALLFPEMPADELRELAADIKKRGLLHPIQLLDGAILDGRNRLKGCQLAGVKPSFAAVPNTIDPFDFVLSCNVHRRHLTPAQRREVVAAVLRKRPQASNRRVAQEAGSDHKTVGAVREELEHGGEIPHHAERVGRDGVKQPVERAAAKRAAHVSQQEQCANAYKSSNEYPKYPVSNAVDRWLHTVIDGIKAIEKDHGYFGGLADKPGWNPQRRDGIVINLDYLRSVVSELLNRLEPPQQETHNPYDDLLRNVREMAAQPTAKEREACKVLGIPWPPTQKSLVDAYRIYAKKNHPDRSGSTEAMVKGNSARECVLKYLDRQAK